MAEQKNKSKGAAPAPKSGGAAAKRPKKKKQQSSAGAILFGVLVFLGICVTVGLFIRSSLNKNLEGIKEKTEELVPNGFTYPTEYEEYVLKYSSEFGVDPAFVFSVIKVESSFMPRAESAVGARGLMQLMNEAYDWVKFRLGDDSESFDDMYDPETNIRYGTYYLSFLLDRYDGSIDLTAAAYHCGMGMVDGWLEDGTIDAENFKVEDIPKENDQTSHYVNKINTAYKAYKEIMAERNITTTTTQATQTETQTEIQTEPQIETQPEPYYEPDYDNGGQYDYYEPDYGYDYQYDYEPEYY